MQKKLKPQQPTKPAQQLELRSNDQPQVEQPQTPPRKVFKLFKDQWMRGVQGRLYSYSSGRSCVWGLFERQLGASCVALNGVASPHEDHISQDYDPEGHAELKRVLKIARSGRDTRNGDVRSLEESAIYMNDRPACACTDKERIDAFREIWDEFGYDIEVVE